MFDLVADVDAYKQFLPWCTESDIVSSGQGAEQSDGSYDVVARLGLSQG
jgi:ribosome-associated toxin RatA of RatAB toxin-antitoxin module